MRRRIGICGVLVLLLAACANVPGLAPAPRAVVLAMPYIPNVQFSQYYVAASRGYYAAEGLNVTFDYNFEADPNAFDVAQQEIFRQMETDAFPRFLHSEAARNLAKDFTDRFVQNLSWQEARLI